jgi:hypothetical protein
MIGFFKDFPQKQKVKERLFTTTTINISPIDISSTSMVQQYFSLKIENVSNVSNFST